LCVSGVRVNSSSAAFYLTKEIDYFEWVNHIISEYLFFSIASQPIITFPSVENNVAYSKLTALLFTPADEPIFYAADLLQYAFFW
jgi:hypothetical protein